MNRPWLIVRVGGTYEQHAHLKTRKDAERVRALIDAGRYPYSKEYRVALSRLLTEEEYRGLKKKPRYYNQSRVLK